MANHSQYNVEYDEGQVLNAGLGSRDPLNHLGQGGEIVDKHEHDTNMIEVVQRLDPDVAAAVQARRNGGSVAGLNLQPCKASNQDPKEI